ncbi:sensor histidine kinase [Spirosoma radiotolerans]|uniref:histidine kinase n=1 Tax=Spirosoma radiotolerans TaxID=1379870 RepID=A0A0E3ZW97_9BACT|nr:response regulator [Spirosoma radiotolerans]AKD56523.1 histidine kinase [Spirosoma radiotolerans]
MILLVDDRPENIIPLKKILELHRFSVDTAESGEEALKKVLKTDYSVIILDVQMPGMDGFEVANAIAGFSKTRDTSIIFLSAVNTEKRFITKGYTSGGVDYLTKPVDPDILVLKVKTLEKLYQQQQELRATQDSLRKEVEVRKQAQEALTEQMQTLQVVLSSLPQMAFTIAPDGKIEYVNEHWFQYAISSSTFPEAHPDDNVWEDWKQAFVNGTELTREVRLKGLNTGDFRYHLLRIIPISQQGILSRWIGTFTDIHPQKQAAELLEQQVELRTHELMLKNAELEQTNHELQQFTWVVSHDLKEPLRKIQLLNDTIKEKFLKENPDAVSYLDRSIRSSARMSTLINDLLAYSQLSVPEAFQPTDLNALLDELLLDFDDALQRKQAVIDVGQLPVIDTIPTRMRQVFQNLISNALKFSKESVPPVITIRAEQIDTKAIDGQPRPTGAFCRIIVQDNGIGFDEKFLGRIFVIFQRLHTQTNYEGTGIGLAIAKKNVDKHHGLISAQSRINEGARFILILPIRQPR